MGRYTAGIIVLTLGVYFFLREFGWLPAHLGLSKLWPLFLIGAGVALLVQAKNKK